MIRNPYQQYRATTVQTANPVDLVLMLYKGILRFTQQGIEAVERKDVKVAHEGFTRAQDVIAELVSTLDFEQGGDVARNLIAVYEYAHRQLVTANMRKDAALAREVIRIFREL